MQSRLTAFSRFNEDESQIRSVEASHNFATVNRMALMLLKKDKSQKLGIKNKRLMAGWDHQYMLSVLTNA